MAEMVTFMRMELQSGGSPCVDRDILNQRLPAAPIECSVSSAQAIHEEVIVSRKNGGGKSSRGNSDEVVSPRSVLDGCKTKSYADTSRTDGSYRAGTMATTTTTTTTTTHTTTTTYTEPSTSPTTPTARHDGPLWKDAIRTWRSSTKRRLAAGLPSLGPTMSSLRRFSIRRGTGTWRCAAAGQADEHEFSILRSSYSFRTFSFSELKKATRNFSKENVVGRGGYAKVYRGCLPGGELVAVKKLSTAAAPDRDRRVESFLSELGHAVNVRHPNVARLVGVGVDGGEHLVFPFSRLGCLSGRLHGSDEETMPWEARYRVAMGAARGLEYLHERCARRIVHRDVKPANILLKDDYEPLICDFGLAKWLPAKLTHYQVTTFEGTFGYVPPEYTTHGIYNEKTDVFAYGVVLLELLTGRRAIDAKKLSLLAWARPFLDSEDETPRMVDPALGGRYDAEQFGVVAFAAKLCIHTSATLRPQMSQVARILRGEETHQRSNKGHERTTSDQTVELHETDGHDATRCLDDLSRHKALAFDFEGESTSWE